MEASYPAYNRPIRDRLTASPQSAPPTRLNCHGSFQRMEPRILAAAGMNVRCTVSLLKSSEVLAGNLASEVLFPASLLPQPLPLGLRQLARPLLANIARAVLGGARGWHCATVT